MRGQMEVSLCKGKVRRCRNLRTQDLFINQRETCACKLAGKDDIYIAGKKVRRGMVEGEIMEDIRGEENQFVGSN